MITEDRKLTHQGARAVPIGPTSGPAARPLALRAAALPRAPIAAFVVAGSAALGALSLLPQLGVPGTGPFGLDSELSDLGLGAAWSTLLLLGACLSAALAAEAVRSGATAFLAAFFAFMALDESFQFHETLERVTGVDWQLLYLPVVALAGAAMLAVSWRLHRDGSRRAVVQLACGAVAWTVAGGLEMVQWDGDRRVSGYYPLSVSEELLEMVGSLLFALAMLTALQHALRTAAARRC